MHPHANISPEEFDQIAQRSEAWLPIVKQIAAATESDLNLKQFSEGSNIVFAAGPHRVIKLFPLFLEFQFKAEERALSLVYSHVKTKTPKLLDSGYFEGWPFLVMERLKGVALSQMWPTLSFHDRRGILSQIGEITSAHHKIVVEQNSIPSPLWSRFVESQVSGCVDRHAKLGLPPHLLAEIPDYLGKNLTAIPQDLNHPVILTGEYTPGNILIELMSEQWKISGLVDYGDAMIGFHEYDFLGPATFLASGNKDLLVALLSGYGYKSQDMNLGLARG